MKIHFYLYGLIIFFWGAIAGSIMTIAELKSKVLGLGIGILLEIIAIIFTLKIKKVTLRPPSHSE